MDIVPNIWCCSGSRFRISIEVTANQKGTLVLSESYYPGWNATVDGKYVNIIPSNYLFQGVEIDSGKHKIVFEYRPYSFGYI